MGDSPEKNDYIRFDSVQPTRCCLMTLIELICEARNLAITMLVLLVVAQYCTLYLVFLYSFLWCRSTCCQSFSVLLECLTFFVHILHWAVSSLPLCYCCPCQTLPRRQTLVTYGYNRMTLSLILYQLYTLISLNSKQFSKFYVNITFTDAVTVNRRVIGIENELKNASQRPKVRT